AAIDAPDRAATSARDAIGPTVQQALPGLERGGRRRLQELAQRLGHALALAQRAQASPQPLQAPALGTTWLLGHAQAQHVQRGLEAAARDARVVNRHRIALAQLLDRFAQFLELAAGVLLHRLLGVHAGSTDSRAFGWSDSSN